MRGERNPTRKSPKSPKKGAERRNPKTPKCKNSEERTDEIRRRKGPGREPKKKHDGRNAKKETPNRNTLRNECPKNEARERKSGDQAKKAKKENQGKGPEERTCLARVHRVTAAVFVRCGSIFGLVSSGLFLSVSAVALLSPGALLCVCFSFCWGCRFGVVFPGLFLSVSAAAPLSVA